MQGTPVYDETLDDGAGAQWAAECVQYLGAHPFPARQDDLLAALVHDRAPGRLLHHLATLDPTAVYATLEDALAECARRAPATVSAQAH